LKGLFGKYISTGEKCHISVCGRQGTEEGGRKVVYIGFRYMVGDKKSRGSRGRPGRKERLVKEEAILLVHVVGMELCFSYHLEDTNLMERMLVL
jgi:hypothetical protein